MAKTEKVKLDVNARVFGTPEVTKLDFALTSMMNKTERMDALKTKILARNKALLTTLRMEVDQRNLQSKGADKYNAELTEAQTRIDALDASEKKLTQTRKTKYLQDLAQGKLGATEAERKGALIILEDQHTRSVQENARALQMRRRETLAATMSIFGMTMSIWQVTNAMSALAGENKELKKDIMSLQAIMMGATGPVLLAMGMMQLKLAWTNLHVAIKAGLPILFIVSSLYIALTANSKELRIAAGALTGALVALTVVKAKAAAVSYMKAHATNVETGATLAQMAVSSLGLALPILAGAVIGALAIAATLPSAQTGIGQRRRVRRNAVANLHEGEDVVSAPMEDWNAWGGSRSGGATLITIIDGEVIDSVEAKRTQRHDYLGVR